MDKWNDQLEIGGDAWEDVNEALEALEGHEDAPSASFEERAAAAFDEMDAEDEDLPHLIRVNDQLRSLVSILRGHL